jgi:hypothetical protein
MCALSSCQPLPSIVCRRVCNQAMWLEPNFQQAAVSSAQTHAQDPKVVKVVQVFFQANGADDLLGLSSASGCWPAGMTSDGLLAELLNRCGKVGPPQSQTCNQPGLHCGDAWLVLDGSLCGDVAEALCPLLCSDLISMRSGTRVCVPHNMRVIVETCSLAGCSPTVLCTAAVCAIHVPISGGFSLLEQMGDEMLEKCSLLPKVWNSLYHAMLFHASQWHHTACITVMAS